MNNLPSLPPKPPASSTSLDQWFEYLIVLSPPPAIAAEVERMKRHLHKKFGAEFSALWSKAHITLLLIHRARSNEARLCEIIRGVCAQHAVFDLHFDGYGCFQESRTVFVNPVEKERIAELGSDIGHFVLFDQMMAGKKVYLSPEPHMTIAKGLFKHGWFELAWRTFKDRTYAREMRAGKVLVLRRGMNPKTYYARACEIVLGSGA